MSAPLLRVSGLSVEYVPGVPVVRDASLRVESGEALGIIGESGSGKTTLLYAMAALLPEPGRTTAGGVEFRGDDLLGMPLPRREALRGREIAIVFQGAMHSLNPVIRIGSLFDEILRLRLGVRDRRERRRRAIEALELVDIPERALRMFAHELSGGMRQRVLIALCVMCRPSLILADEPTTALDVVVQAEILDKLDALRRELGFGLVIVSHDLGVVSQYCDRIAVMLDGDIVEQGTAREVLATPQHAHTRALIESYPSVDRRLDDLRVIPERSTADEETS